MKRLKRRLSAAFRPHSAVVDNAPYHESGSFTGPPCHPMQLHTSHSVPSYLRSSSITLSDSISELAERLASEGVIMEESDGVTNIVQINGNGCDRGFRYDAPPSARYPYRSVSYHHGVDVHPEPPISTTAKVLMRPKKKQKEKEKEEAKKSNGRINSWHSSRCESNVGVGVGGPAGRRLSHVQYHHNGLFYGHHRGGFIGVLLHSLPLPRHSSAANRRSASVGLSSLATACVSSRVFRSFLNGRCLRWGSNRSSRRPQRRPRRRDFDERARGFQCHDAEWRTSSGEWRMSNGIARTWTMLIGVE
uniref:Uncharacterized protein n=1 Tax=Plectus sambesii TaxID=2011161 RepID=A0A914W8V9_9BILA